MATTRRSKAAPAGRHWLWSDWSWLQRLGAVAAALLAVLALMGTVAAWSKAKFGQPPWVNMTAYEGLENIVAEVQGSVYVDKEVRYNQELNRLEDKRQRQKLNQSEEDYYQRLKRDLRNLQQSIERIEQTNKPVKGK